VRTLLNPVSARVRAYNHRGRNPVRKRGVLSVSPAWAQI
jgi:hypothetical protein